MRCGAFDANEHWKTLAICHGHDLGSFAAFGFTNLQAPFFAGAKLASMKASRTSIAPLSFKSKASTSRIPFITQNAPIAERDGGRSEMMGMPREDQPMRRQCAAPTECRSTPIGGSST